MNLKKENKKKKTQALATFDTKNSWEMFAKK